MSSLWSEQFQAARRPETAGLADASAQIVVPQSPAGGLPPPPPPPPAPPRPRASAAVSPGARARLPLLLLQVLDVLTQGLALLDAEGQVLYANSAAVQACGGGSSLRLGGQASARGADAKRLAHAVDHAAQGHWSMLILGGERSADSPETGCGTEGSGHVGPPAPGDERRVVGLVPLAGDPACPEAAVLMVIGGEPGASALAMHFFCEQFGVTAAERRVLLALGQGAKPADIARDHRVALCTVRTQVAQLRQKVDVPDIGQLLRVLLSLPPVAQPLRQRWG